MSSESCYSFQYSVALRNIFTLTEEQSIIMYVLIPISAICCIINFGLFIKIPSIRQPPADILFFVTIFSFVILACYFSTIIYNQVHPPLLNAIIPGDFDSFCLGTGYLILTSFIGELVYNVIFSCYYIVKIRNPLKSWVNQNRQIHVLCFIIIGIGSGILYLTDTVGVSIFGVCYFKVSLLSTYALFALSAVYVLVLIVCSIIFLKYLNGVAKRDPRIRIYCKYYFKYLVLFTIVNCIQNICLLTLSIGCEIDRTQSYIKFFKILVNITMVTLPIFVTIIILNHPEINLNKLRDMFKKQKQRDLTFYNQMVTTNRTTVDIQLLKFNNIENDEGFFKKLKQLNRAYLLGTILGCICIQQQEYIHSEVFYWNYLQKHQYQLSQGVVRLYPDIFSDKIVPICLRFISYANASFRYIQKLDNIYNISQELNPQRNLKQIFNNASTDGGASGQFFFFNYSQTLILKTITQKQLNVLLERISEYFQYFKNNPNSFIVKLYGVYTIVNPETNQKINFMIMGNLRSIIPKKYVIRTYDLKGSAYARQVIKFNDQQSKQWYTRTLKDVDFIKNQGKVWLNQINTSYIQNILTQDSLFLFQLGLIDYSLILIKIDYNAYLLDLQDGTNFSNQKNMYKSSKQAGIVYIFGIIDYLQTWNTKKKSERWWKSILNKRQQISAQDPQFYCRRFREHVINQIFS